MTDVVDANTRSRMMAGIRGRDTAPEMLVRRGLHRRGFRYRLHVAGVPGKPDILLVRWRVALFINGCFWHSHDCHLFRLPATRTEFWRSKLAGNRRRDAVVACALRAAGWRRLVVWECALKGRQRLEPGLLIERISRWITGGEERGEIAGEDLSRTGRESMLPRCVAQRVTEGAGHE